MQLSKNYRRKDSLFDDLLDEEEVKDVKFVITNNKMPMKYKKQDGAISPLLKKKVIKLQTPFQLTY